MLRSQYHRRREGRGDQRREGFRDTYMCPWYSVDVVTKPSGAAARPRHGQLDRHAKYHARAGILVLHGQGMEISPLRTRWAHKGILFLFYRTLFPLSMIP